MHLVIVNTDKNHPVLAQQVAGEKEAGVHHAQPVGVKTTAGLGIGRLLDPLFAHLPGVAQIILEPFAVVIGIDEFVAGVVRRVDIDHLDLAVIRLLQQLEDFEIVPFDDLILCRIPGHTLRRLRQERRDTGNLHVAKGFGLAGPGKTVTLSAFLQRRAQSRFQFVEIDLPLAENLRRNFVQMRQQPGGQIWSGQREFVVGYVGHKCVSFLKICAPESLQQAQK